MGDVREIPRAIHSDRMPTYTLTVNGTQHTVEAESDMPLLWVLRDLLGLTGTKYACGVGACRSCTVLIDGDAIASCVQPVSAVGQKAVLTIEGLSESGDHPLQVFWQELNVPQCGFCQAGQIMHAAGWVKNNVNPSDEDIERMQSPNLCRCGTYPRIKEAIRKAAPHVEG
jgi:aerobic-type carbon monoxide dehydrogenase small subunit (CoxS/CutS family)